MPGCCVRRIWKGLRPSLPRQPRSTRAAPSSGLALDLTREHRVSELIQQAAKERLLQHPDRADALLTQARTLDPGNELVLEHSNQPSPAQPPHGLVATTPEIGFAGPLQLVPNDVRTEQHLRGDIRQVLTQLTASYGLKVTFDESVGTQPVRFDLDARTYREAMPILLHMGHLFATPIDAKTVLVAKDTEENRQRLERQVEETLYVPALTNEQINELINIVKNVYDVKQVIAAPSSGTLILRAPEETLKAVNYTLADLVDGGAEVAVELKLLEVDKSISRNVGVVPPNSVGTISVAGEAQSIVANKRIGGLDADQLGSLCADGKLCDRHDRRGRDPGALGRGDGREREQPARFVRRRTNAVRRQRGVGCDLESCPELGGYARP